MKREKFKLNKVIKTIIPHIYILLFILKHIVEYCKWVLNVSFSKVMFHFPIQWQQLAKFEVVSNNIFREDFRKLINMRHFLLVFT